MSIRRWSLRAGLGLLGTLWLVACVDEASHLTPPQRFTSASSAADPTVDSVDPNNAPQDTTLDVAVVGSGFERGSKADLALGGVVSSKVRTNTTRFINQRKLIANITIAADADAALYDVIVTTSDGRKGIGIELFEVFTRVGPNLGSPITVTFRDDANDRTTSDGRGSYVDGQCGVTATFNLTDARLDPDSYRIHPKEQTACGGRDPRKVIVSFSTRVDGSPPGGQDGNTVGYTFFKVNEVELVAEADATVLRSAVAHGPGCAHGLRFNPNLDPQSDYVEVRKNADQTWTVATQAYPNDVAVCVPDEDSTNPPPRSYYHMPFSVTVRLK